MMLFSEKMKKKFVVVCIPLDGQHVLVLSLLCPH